MFDTTTLRQRQSKVQILPAGISAARGSQNVGTFRLLAASKASEQVVVEDSQLIADACSGNTAAFGQLVVRYQDRLYNTLVHVVGSAEDAADVVQDAFVQAFLKLDTFHGASAFYTWLYRIAFRPCDQPP